MTPWDIPAAISLLEAVAKRLQDAASDADVIARFGGDEFVILQAPIESHDQAEALATRVLRRCQAPTI